MNKLDTGFLLKNHRDRWLPLTWVDIDLETSFYFLIIFSNRKPWSFYWTSGHNLLLWAWNRQWARLVFINEKYCPCNPATKGDCLVDAFWQGQDVAPAATSPPPSVLSSRRFNQNQQPPSQRFFLSSGTPSSHPQPPPLKEISWHLELGLAHDKHSINICYLMARWIRSAVIFHFSQRCTAGSL